MITIEQKKEAVRQFIIRAVPGIREHYDRCMSCGFGFEYCKHFKGCTLSFNDREITLADVIYTYMGSPEVPQRAGKWAEIIVNWNLLQDFDHQSEAFYLFAWELLYE